MAVQEVPVTTNASRLKRFFREAKAELRKVSWPNKQELTSSTGIVFISVVVVSAMIWFIDTALTGLLRVIIK